MELDRTASFDGGDKEERNSCNGVDQGRELHGAIVAKRSNEDLCGRCGSGTIMHDYTTVYCVSPRIFVLSNCHVLKIENVPFLDAISTHCAVYFRLRGVLPYWSMASTEER